MGWTSPRVEIPDRRDRERHLRVAWHASERTVIVSQWRHGVCVATTPVEVTEVPQLVNLLVKALGEATTTAPIAERAPSPRTIRHDLKTLLRSRLCPRIAPVVTLSSYRRRRRPPP